jgi:hypothetical protein
MRANSRVSGHHRSSAKPTSGAQIRLRTRRYICDRLRVARFWKLVLRYGAFVTFTQAKQIGKARAGFSTTTRSHSLSSDQTVSVPASGCHPSVFISGPKDICGSWCNPESEVAERRIYSSRIDRSLAPSSVETSGSPLHPVPALGSLTSTLGRRWMITADYTDFTD